THFTITHHNLITSLFFFTDPSTTQIYTLSLHDALPILMALMGDTVDNIPGAKGIGEKGATELIQKYGSVEKALDHADEVSNKRRSEEHTSELQSPYDLVCRLLLEKKKKKNIKK